MATRRNDRANQAGAAKPSKPKEKAPVVRKARVPDASPPADRSFGAILRDRREELKRTDRRYSVRQVANRVGVEPSYLSKVERDEVAPPSEETILRLASELDLDPDTLLALAGKISTDLKEVIRRRPQLFAQLIRDLRDLPDHAVLRIVREVRDGDW
jgi:transcriptional regulator with XRE-family HTH domain